MGKSGLLHHPLPCLLIFCILFLFFCNFANKNMDHQENANLYPDTLSISEDDGIRSIVIKQGPTELTISQIGDWFSNGLTYNLRSEYNDSCIFAKVTWILADSIEILSYMESAVFQGDSIYDINQDGINDLVLTYKDGESRLCKMYLMGTDGKVYVEKEIWNYYPLLNQEFVKKDKLISF